jgi:hypothetical protein
VKADEAISIPVTSRALSAQSAGARLATALAMTEARTAIGLAALTFIFYLLWSKGFSPQWTLYLIAFLCILLPNFLGTVLIVLLETLYVIEWPITFILSRPIRVISPRS